MVEVICDTNFLIHLANKRIKNFDKISIDFGDLTFLVPNVVHYELIQLKNNPRKTIEIEKTLEYIKKFKSIPINGTYADKAILEYVKLKKSFVGTMDKELKKFTKNFGGTIISFQNDSLVLES